MTRCAVIGAGAWGTALADLLARNGHDVRIWAYEWDVVESINRLHQNRRFLPGSPLYDTIRAFNGIEEALADAELKAELDTQATRPQRHAQDVPAALRVALNQLAA